MIWEFVAVQQTLFTLFCVVRVRALYKWEEVSDPPIIQLNDEWDNPALYYTLPSILDVWHSSTVHYLREPRAVLNLFKNRCFSFEESWDPDSGHPRNPFINIEGNSNAIRDHIAREVAEELKGELLVNPPTCLVPLKYLYGNTSHILHGPYISLGMYASSHAVKVHWGLRPVIMTGYWNDMTAATLADIFINTTIPRSKSCLYEFPKDLLRPDLTLFINTHNHAPDSREETRPPVWRSRFTESFLRFRKVKLREVKWFGADNVTATILHLIEHELGEKFDLSIN